MTDGFAPTRDIHVAAISTVPLGHTTIAPVFARCLALIVVTADPRLTQIVETSPYDVANDVRIVAHKFPVPERIARETLCLPHHALGVSLVVAGVLVNHIVIAHHIKYLSVRIVDLPITVP